MATFLLTDWFFFFLSAVCAIFFCAFFHSLNVCMYVWIVGAWLMVYYTDAARGFGEREKKSFFMHLFLTSGERSDKDTFFLIFMTLLRESRREKLANRVDIFLPIIRGAMKRGLRNKNFHLENLAISVTSGDPTDMLHNKERKHWSDSQKKRD